MLKGHGGVVIGSEMSGSVRKVTISNCVFDGTDRGIRLKTMRGRGGVVEEIRVSNIVMKNIRLEGFTFDMNYWKTNEGPVTEETPAFRNIHISNVTGTQVNKACNMIGLEEMPVNNVTFNNINMSAKEGFILQMAKNIELVNVEVSAQNGPAFSISEVDFLTLNNVKSCQPSAEFPVIDVLSSNNIFIYNCFPVAGTNVFLMAVGSLSSNIVLSNNNFTLTKTPVVKGPGLRKDAIIMKD
jgi:polygalacturonase